MKCDSCNERRGKLHIVTYDGKQEKWCDDCITDESIRSALFEDAISDGEPWALQGNPELWHPRYKEDN